MCSEDLQDAVAGGDADGWVLLGHDWWKLSLSSVDWTFCQRRHWTAAGERLPTHPRPPLYHNTLISNIDQPNSGDDDVELSSSLVGVADAEAAVKRYEVAVGIAYDIDPSLAIFYPTRPLLCSGELTDADMRRMRNQWDECVDTLLGGIFEPCDFTVALDPKYRSDFWGADFTASSPTKDNVSNSTISPDVTDLTDSDTSLDSDLDPPPSTPYADKKSYAEVLFDRAKSSLREGVVLSPSAAKPLNASALSFVPAFELDSITPPSPSSDLPYVSPTYEFHFPSLNTQSSNRLPLQRDEQGFYTEVATSGSSELNLATTRSSTPKRQPSQSLQGMLGDSVAARSRSSKTREIVDRLRSSGSSRRHRRSKGESSLRHSMDSRHSGSIEDVDKSFNEVDGWIMGLDGADKKEDWVQGLFQCRSNTQTQFNGKDGHEHSPSTTSTSFTPSTPSSASSGISNLPSPTSPVTSIRNPSKPAAVNVPQFPFPPFFSGPFTAPPIAAYPGSYGLPSVPMVPPQGSTLQMLQMQQAHWRLQMPQAYVMPPAVYMRRP